MRVMSTELLIFLHHYYKNKVEYKQEFTVPLYPATFRAIKAQWTLKSRRYL